uniref:Basement membrane proteoglycan n=1 Tax=Globodera pallida TaxID=36090 RepID=A0A183CLT6_GLOPA
MRRRRVSAMALLPLVLLIVPQIANSTDNNQRSHRTGRQRAFNEELQINVYPPELSVAEGRKASFECRARATDNSHYPEVRWTRVGGRLPDGVHEGGGTLTIPQAQRHQSGQYACVAMHNGRTVEAYATLHVKPYGPAEEMGGDPTIIAAGCMADERACGNNECVKLEYVCDGEPDCRDRSDELNCPAKRNCEPNEFRCRNDKCVQKMWLCDGDDDCGDKSDEQNCGQRQPGDMCQPTEFRCTNGRQCVPQSFQCDGTNDCQDGSDEIGCVQPTVVQAPESNKVVQQGQDFKLTCRAVGVPDPYINWRLNWADVWRGRHFERPKCTTDGPRSVHCEAINVKGRVLATPDCIVRIVSIPAPQAPQPPPPPPPEPQRLTCNAQGAYSPYTDTRGQCQCKPLTTGTTCSQCVQGAYHLSDRAPQGCLKCFCFGVTDRCHSSGLYRTKEKLFFAGDSQGIELSNVQGQAQPGIQFDFEQYGFLTHKEPHFSQTLYWKLPQRFLGDKVTAYGGDLSVQLQYQGAGQIREEPLVVIQGNGVTLVHKPRDQESQFTPGHPFAVSVNTYEGGVGTLSVQNAQPMDQGAYTCEAINVKGRVLATPDCIVRIVSIPAPQAPQPPPPPPPEPQRLTCNAQGAYSPYTDTRGQCQCKPLTTGTTCSQCVQGAYHLSDRAPQGCLNGLYRTKEKLFFAGDSQGIELSNVQGQAQPGIQFDFEQYGFLTHKEPHFSQTLYWKLPQRFLGDKVTAYGGDLSVQLQYQGAGQIREEPLVVIQGNGVTLVHKPRDQESQFTPGHPFAVSVNTYEQNYEHQNGSPASREDLMMALADLNLVLIRATHTDDQSSSRWDLIVK